MRPWNVMLVIVILSAVAARGGTGSWTRQSGRFATFEGPPGMVRNAKAQGVDSIQESYLSPDITFGFDSETPKLPASLQQELKRTVAAWSAERQAGDWSKSQYVPDGGAIHAFDDPKNLEIYHLRYYLYLGFAAGEANFSLHIYFRSLDNLDAIEHLLKSIRLKTQ